MHSNVIILAADNNYANHARSLMVNCRRQGQWQGDFALIVPRGMDTSDFSNRGIHVVESDDDDAFYQKYYIFSPFFHKWGCAFYVDCDVLVQGALEPLMAELDNHSMLAFREHFNLFHCFTYWTSCKTYNEAPKGIYDWLWENYSPLYQQFNTGMILFKPNALAPDALDQLNVMHDKLAPINVHVIRGTDQPVINLTFYKQFTEIRDRLFTHFSFEGPQTLVMHYCSGYAPWINKEDPGMDAYHIPKLGVSCYALYSQNLSLWNEVFPQC